MTQTKQSRELLALALIAGARVDGDKVIVSVKGGNDAARFVCGAIVADIDRHCAGSGAEPVDMVLHCPKCGLQHLDGVEGGPEAQPDGTVHTEVSWENPPHRSHLCHGCGHIWRPADVPTNGVAAVKTTGKADSPLAASPAPAVPSEVERGRAAQAAAVMPMIGPLLDNVSPNLVEDFPELYRKLRLIEHAMETADDGALAACQQPAASKKDETK
jgi:hypothetical protein